MQRTFKRIYGERIRDIKRDIGFVLLAVVNAEEALLSCKTRKSEANAFSHLW